MGHFNSPPDLVGHLQQMEQRIATLEQMPKLAPGTVSSPARLPGTVYQPGNPLRPTLVIAQAVPTFGASGSMQLNTDSSNPPTTAVSQVFFNIAGGGQVTGALIALVQPGHYYRFVGTGTVGPVTEYQF